MDQNNNREFLLEQLGQFLQNYKLSQYYDTFVAEGFDRLLSLFDITESDLISLHVKRGHRRVLQRAIATARGVPLTTPIMINYGYDDQDHTAKPGTTITTTTTTVTKTIESPKESPLKKYNQRKRKQFVPVKPVTAFDEFLKQVKNELSGDEHIELSDAILIAQERWNRLSVHQKERYEREALHANSDYVMDFNYDDQKF
ncbi:uncharacterized protein B0P05DRAFT_293614 [Gilbertella persicaria]|uniref:uncharacterized protein n=1 Tax=Gilbertella persicaria TaxID=101096 RepID=UPI00221EA84F|nr:uncharacterized protein B0P05DRAFT_293614 [Gilbertella persicaria]KAI8090935.1 hypothetical protein B0P05DRAFT_293614 [Gilbertella persicaria]